MLTLYLRVWSRIIPQVAAISHLRKLVVKGGREESIFPVSPLGVFFFFFHQVF